MADGTITWRNINGPNPAEAIRPLAFAQNSINSAFDNFNKVLEARQAANQNVYDRGQEADVLSFKEALQNARTPDDVRALQQQGMLDNIRARLDPKYRAQVLGLEDKRNQETQQNLLAQREFDTKNFAYQNQGTINQARLLATQGKTDEAQALLDPLGANYDGSAILEKAIAARRAGNQETRAQNAEIRTADLHPLDMAAKRNANTLAGYQVEEAGNRAKDLREQRDAEDILGRLAAARRNEVDANTGKLTQAARDMQFADVYNRDGTLNISALSSGQRAGLTQYLKNIGGPTLDSVEFGDTAAKEKAMRVALKANLAPRNVDAVAKNADGWFDTTGSPSIGNDALVKRIDTAAEDALAAEQRAKYGTPLAPGQMADDYMTKAADIVAQYAKPGSAVYGRYMAAVGDLVKKGGYQVKDPKTGEVTRFVPDINSLGAVMASAANPWLWRSQGDMEDVFKEWSKNTETKKGAAEAVQNLRRTATRAILKAQDTKK